MLVGLEVGFREQFRLYMEQNTHIHGTYLSVQLDKDSSFALVNLAKKNRIKNIIDPAKMHCTVIYSRKGAPAIAEHFINLPIKAKAKGWKIFDTQDGKKALTLELDSPELQKLHKDLMTKYKTTYDYDTYIPHVTLSYNYLGEELKYNYSNRKLLVFDKKKCTPLDPEWKE